MGSWECIATYFWPIATATELRWDGFLNTNHNVDTESLIIDLFFLHFDTVFIAAKCTVPSSVIRLTNCARLKKKQRVYCNHHLMLKCNVRTCMFKHSAAETDQQLEILYS